MVIEDPKLKAFVESPITNEFGLSVEEVANACKGYGRFSAWLNGNVSQIIDVLNTVKDQGMSPAYFASYEATEGYNSSWGWLNHTVPQGNPTQDAIYVSNVVVTTSKNMSANPSWIDYGNPVDFVPQSVKNEGNAHFQNMASGTIGRSFIPLTAAATWEVYYPQGLLAEYNGVQNYGAPLTKSMELIEQWGGTITGGNNGGDGETENWKPQVIQILNQGENELQNNISIDTSSLEEQLMQGIKKIFDPPVFLNSYNFYTNLYFKITKTYENMQKINPTTKLEAVIRAIINETLKDIEVDIPIQEVFNSMRNQVNAISGGNNGGGSNEKVFPVDKNSSGINFWYPPHQTDLEHNMDYGYRTSGVWHAGYDIGGGFSSHDIYAVRSGTVVDVRYQDLSGYLIIIEHEHDEYFTLYQHLLADSTIVSIGDQVEAGEKIARMGGSGGNYAIHLHFELATSPNDFWTTRTIDPKPYLEITGDNQSNLPNPV